MRKITLLYAHSNFVEYIEIWAIEQDMSKSRTNDGRKHHIQNKFIKLIIFDALFLEHSMNDKIAKNESSYKE